MSISSVYMFKFNFYLTLKFIKIVYPKTIFFKIPQLTILSLNSTFKICSREKEILPQRFPIINTHSIYTPIQILHISHHSKKKPP